MMTPEAALHDSDLLPRERRREWAEMVLAVSIQDACRNRGGLLERLDEEELLPPESWLHAWQTVSAPDSDDESPWFEASCRERLREEVDRFAARLFDLIPESRQAAWQALRNESAEFSDVAFRLDRLKPALSLDVGEIDQAPKSLRPLLESIRHTFPLAPPCQAEEWRKRLEQLLQSTNAFGNVLDLRRRFPCWVELIPEFLSSIAFLRDERLSRGGVLEMREGLSLEEVRDFSSRFPSRKATSPSGDLRRGDPKFALAVVVSVFVLLGLIRLLASSSRPQPKSSLPTLVRPTIPPIEIESPPAVRQLPQDP